MSLLSPATGHRRTVGAAAVRALQDAVPGVHLPGSEPYARLTRTSNLLHPVAPLAVVEVTGPDDVSATVRLAAAFGVPVAVQGTGHGAAEEMRDAILVHTAALDELTVHPQERWARIGAGVRWARVLEAAAPHGLAALCGSSPDVGAVGMLTGGGLGPVARSHGLSSDTVRAFDVVTGDGVLRRVTADEHPDLFWGLRGGKGTLGIVTAVEVDLVALPEVYAGGLWFAEADVPGVLRTWAQWCELLPHEGTTSVAVMRLPDVEPFPAPLRGQVTLHVRFAWTGDAAVGEEMVRALRAVAAPVLDTVRRMPYAALGEVHDDPVDPMPLHETHHLLDGFGVAGADRLLELVGPGVPSAQAMVEVRQLGGRVREGDPCAYAHRDAAYSLFVVGLMVPEVAQVVTRDAARIEAGMAPWLRDGGLPNFTGGSGPAWAQRVFTPLVARRLRALSRTYDPAGVLLAARGVRG
ncbi:FAD-binding oxidoreductase [Cellulomonas fimi]|uniref:FAD linked oxidase domain protein n=1 Tax=Cellulomonas fimi (strain ATCC 484 / DSM 20113 / JCM 1341 / CCUG 24087 / LMG 16345 / NBRC 15513 / NCIMB 8980 / NCTC 7547 / NRS-133) TaxID=590998 RepID=F4H045_CELFA|nr:FAD-binding oxidoreductase [Cellulomonas fimi]AEE44967.1 FAD linked oxidase domain protein [Cellulomonas fimi ATCC 484]NNH07209.1 FAD-binding oxidoreductase [Cellulomonas fimi]VEH27827.1 Mitomycin radical oxidase [Cellulomonas fimi]